EPTQNSPPGTRAIAAGQGESGGFGSSGVGGELATACAGAARNVEEAAGGCGDASRCGDALSRLADS
ncbi:MAG TPA: hypothetical protein VER33_06165, partial [Polyangiaceae bacterium]|nr:hypothetical protein [Polyangiaceae bacterium]